MKRKKRIVNRMIVFLFILTVSTLLSSKQGLAYGNEFTIVGKEKYKLQSHYEINNEYVKGDYLYVEGFYFVSDLQNYVTTKGTNRTHEYELAANGKTYKNTGDYKIDMTEMEHRASKDWVTSSETAIAEPGQITKNYRYKDVGFQFKIPLSDFISFEGTSIKHNISITMHCYNTVKGKNVEVPFKTANIIGSSISKPITYKGYTISFDGDLTNSYGVVSAEAAYIRKTPEKVSTNIAQNGGHNLYWTTNDIIFDFSKNSYNNSEKRTWYQAPYGSVWYDSPRYRAKYKSGSSTKGWLASTYISTVEGDRLALSIKNTAPTISASNKSYNEGTLITNAMLLQGVSATDTQDGNVTSKIKLSRGNLPSATTKTKAGTYTVTYSVTDRNNVTTTKKITITVKNVVPSITISNKEEDQKMYNEATLITNAMLLKGISAKDIYDGDITSKIKVDRGNLPNPTTKAKVGTYTVSYTVTDSNNTSTTVKTTVTVKNVVPTITASNKSYNAGLCITNKMLLQGVSANDIYDGDITNKLIISNRGALPNEETKVDAGTYTVTYSVTDSNNATVTKNVQVIVKYAAPTIKAEDIIIDEGTVITKEFLLTTSKAQAKDIIDGDITKKIVIKDLGGLKYDRKAHQGIYTVQISVTNANNISATGSFTVTVNKVHYDIRFISKEYLYTLSNTSKWSTDTTLNKRLVSTLNKTSSSAIQEWKFSKEDVQKIKNFENNNDVLSENVNSKFLAEYKHCRTK